VGATLFIGNLDPDVDEKLLYDTFSAFGMIVNTPKVSRDPDSGISKSFGFVSYDNFESADAAIDAMDGQYLMNKQVSVSYAFKKDGKGEKHGSAAERLLAAEGRKHVQLPNRLFASGPPLAPAMGSAPTPPTPVYPVNGAAPPGGFRPPPPPPPMGYPPNASVGGYW
jgi:splicing factor 3B subunit 4